MWVSVIFVFRKRFNQMSAVSLLMMSINLNDIATLNISGVDHPCIINGIGKGEAVNLLQNDQNDQGREVL